MFDVLPTVNPGTDKTAMPQDEPDDEPVSSARLCCGGVARVVVLSGGFGGLAAAARLVRLRHDVTVLERGDSLGAPIGTYERDGFRFDIGATQITLPATLRDLFRKSGRPLEQELDLVAIEPAARYLLPDRGVLDLPNASRAGTLRAFAAAFGSSTARDWDALIRHGERIWDVLHHHAYEPERRLSWRERRIIAAGTPLLRMVSRRLSHPGARQVLEHLCAEAGFPPPKAPATLIALAYIEQTFGVWRVRGGLHQVIDVLVERVKQRASIRTGVDDETVRRAIDRADVVVSEASAYVPHTTVVLAVDGQSESAERTVPAPGVTIWSPADTDMRPEGCAAWTVQIHLPNDGDAWRAVQAQITGRVRWAQHLAPPQTGTAPDIRHSHHVRIAPTTQLGATVPYIAMSVARVATLIGPA
jgi:Flavin containing amine oxidoreductase